MGRLQVTSLEVLLREELEATPKSIGTLELYISEFKALMNSLTDVDDDDKDCSA